MQRIRVVRLAVVGVALAAGMLAAAVCAGRGAAAGGEDAIAWYRSLAGRAASGKAQNLASPTDGPARSKLDPRAAFHERIRPYLSAGGYHSLFGAGPGSPTPGLPLATAPRAAASETPNELVNDRTGEACFFPGGCTQSEPSIAVSGSNVVIGFNDSRGDFDGTNDISGYSYSVDGGMNWTDGGALPLVGSGDSLSGDPAVVFCNGSFYYASLYRTPSCSSVSGAFVGETEPNDDLASANPVSLGDDFAGTLDSPTDVDIVSFSADEGTALEATTVLGTLIESALLLLDANGTPLAFAEGFQGQLPGIRIDFKIPASGKYYLQVFSFFGSTGSYTLQIRNCGEVLPNSSAVSVSQGTFSGSVLTWGAPVLAAAANNGVEFLDKEYIACDPTTGALGALYVAYTRFQFFPGSGTGQIELVGSTDGGTTWSDPTVVEPEDPPLLNQGAMPAVGPAGEVYVAWEQGGLGTSGTGKATIQLRKSSMDHGATTFPMKTPVAEFVETDFNPPLGLSRVLDFPSIAVDRSGGPHSGNVYVVFEAADRDIRDIKLARSTTGGSSFDPPVRVNDDPSGADQFLPWVTVDPTDGQISVIWYDRRLNPGTAMTDVFLTQSNDGGATFVPGMRVTDMSSSFFVNTDFFPNFGDYINVAADGTSIYATWADARNGDPDVFFSRIPKNTAPFLLLKSFSLDDSGENGDGDGAPEPGESPRLKIVLLNVGARAATGVVAKLNTDTPRVTITQDTSEYSDLMMPGSLAAAQTLYQFRVDPSLTCSTICPPIMAEMYGVDKGGTIVRFPFNTGSSTAVPAPGDTPSGGPDGLAVKSATDAFWVNGFGLDMIIEFNPQTGEEIKGAFPVPSPGMPNCTDGLALVAPTRLFTQNFCEGKLYEINTDTGQVVNASLPGGLGVLGDLAGRDGRLFATIGFTSIAEIDPDTGVVLRSFPAPDLNGDGFPDSVEGLAFDGTLLFAASATAVPPNVAALDPADGKVLAVSPFIAPSVFLSALDALAQAPESVCVPGTSRTVVDLELAITTNQDQDHFSSSLSLPLGREAKTTAFRDEVESGINGWTATGEWHQTTDRAASPTHSWYFGREGPSLRDNAYLDNDAGDLTSPPIDLSGASAATLVFDHYLARELCCDLATVSASSDGFHTRTVLASLDPVVDPAFSEVRLDLSAFAGSPAVQVRFTFTSDASVHFEGWYVDNIRVEQSTFDCGVEVSVRSTTTTLPSPPASVCQRDADCDDGNPCTTDRCVGGQCVSSPLSGFPRAECEFTSARESSLCGPERLDHLITAQLRKVQHVVQAHDSGTPKLSNRLARRLDRELLAILVKVSKARRTGKISPMCRDTIEKNINELRMAIAGLRTGS